MGLALIATPPLCSGAHSSAPPPGAHGEEQRRGPISPALALPSQCQALPARVPALSVPFSTASLRFASMPDSTASSSSTLYFMIRETHSVLPSRDSASCGPGSISVIQTTAPDLPGTGFNDKIQSYICFSRLVLFCLSLVDSIIQLPSNQLFSCSRLGELHSQSPA
jgi:hypothetical protein